jgi:hypothetical protein
MNIITNQMLTNQMLVPLEKKIQRLIDEIEEINKEGRRWW